jgi:phage terminase large subunit-like protein
MLREKPERLDVLQRARRAVDAGHKHKANRLIAERNFGGAMVEAVIKTADPNVSFREVVAFLTGSPQYCFPRAREATRRRSAAP